MSVLRPPQADLQARPERPRLEPKGEYLAKQFAGQPFEYAIVEDIGAPGAFDAVVAGVDAVAHTVRLPALLPFLPLAPCPRVKELTKRVLCGGFSCATPGLAIPLQRRGPRGAHPARRRRHARDPQGCHRSRQGRQARRHVRPLSPRAAPPPCSHRLTPTPPRSRMLRSTSSVAAIQEPREPPSAFTEADWNRFSVAEVAQKGKDASPVHAYLASKALAERAAWDYVEEHPIPLVTIVRPRPSPLALPTTSFLRRASPSLDLPPARPAPEPAARLRPDSARGLDARPAQHVRRHLLRHRPGQEDGGRPARRRRRQLHRRPHACVSFPPSLRSALAARTPARRRSCQATRTDIDLVFARPPAARPQSPTPTSGP